MVMISAERLLGIYEEWSACLDDPIDLPTEVLFLLSERDNFEKLTLTEDERVRLEELDDELVRRWKILAEALPYPASHPRQHWWWFLHEGPQVRSDWQQSAEAKALGQST